MGMHAAGETVLGPGREKRDLGGTGADLKLGLCIAAQLVYLEGGSKCLMDDEPFEDWAHETNEDPPKEPNIGLSP
jgi:hypothetical protein